MKITASRAIAIGVLSLLSGCALGNVPLGMLDGDRALWMLCAMFGLWAWNDLDVRSRTP